MYSSKSGKSRPFIIRPSDKPLTWAVTLNKAIDRLRSTERRNRLQDDEQRESEFSSNSMARVPSKRSGRWRRASWYARRLRSSRLAHDCSAAAGEETVFIFALMPLTQRCNRQACVRGRRGRAADRHGKDWSHGYLDAIRLAVLAIIQDGLAVQPLRRFAIGFLALQIGPSFSRTVLRAYIQASH